MAWPKALEGPATPLHEPLTSESLLQKIPGEPWELMKQLICHDISKNIHSMFDCDENRAVCWWLDTRSISWRKVIHTLDDMGKTSEADTLRDYLEPPKEPNLSVNNVMEVMEGVTNYTVVGKALLVPSGIQEMIKDMCPSDEISALVNYTVTTVPNITWEGIASALYEAGEEEGVKRVKSYIQRFDDPTFTAEEVMEVTKEVEYDVLFNILQIPASVKDIPIEDSDNNESSVSGRKAIVSHALDTHPCPSWRWLVKRLSKCSDRDPAAGIAAKNVARKYMKNLDTGSSVRGGKHNKGKQNLKRLRDEESETSSEDEIHSPHVKRMRHNGMLRKETQSGVPGNTAELLMTIVKKVEQLENRMEEIKENMEKVMGECGGRGGEVLEKDANMEEFKVNGINLLELPADTPNALGLRVFDELFTKDELSSSLVFASKKRTCKKPPLDPKRVEILMKCVNKRFALTEETKKKLISSLNQKCRDIARSRKQAIQ